MIRIASFWGLKAAIIILGIGMVVGCKESRFKTALCPEELVIQKDIYAYVKRYTDEPTARRITIALAQTKYPRTLAAIASVESEFNPRAVGDNGSSFGLYQIQQKHWGEVPQGIDAQTHKAEGIFDDLVRRVGYTEAIKRWNGTGPLSRQYQVRVINRIKEI